MSNNNELQSKLSQAKEAEKAEDFFRAAFFYRDTLAVATKQGNFEIIVGKFWI